MPRPSGGAALANDGVVSCFTSLATANQCDNGSQGKAPSLTHKRDYDVIEDNIYHSGCSRRGGLVLGDVLCIGLVVALVADRDAKRSEAPEHLNIPKPGGRSAYGANRRRYPAQTHRPGSHVGRNW